MLFLSKSEKKSKNEARSSRLSKPFYQNVRGAEPVFAASAKDSGEDAGWIMSLVHSEKTGKSKFVILDAQNFEAKPVATIELPFRVPYGAHGNWIPAESVH